MVGFFLLARFLLYCLLGLMVQVCLSLLAFPEVLEHQPLQQNQLDQLYPKIIDQINIYPGLTSF